MPADKEKKRVRVSESDLVDKPGCERGIALAERSGRDLGKEARPVRVGECFANGLGFACVWRRRPSCDLGDLMAPIQQTAPRIGGEVADGDIELVVVALWEVDGFDAKGPTSGCRRLRR